MDNYYSKSMKKYLLIILSVLIVIFVYLRIPKQDATCTTIDSPDPAISISIEKADEYGLEYRNVESILMPFVELGYMDIRINDFHWKYYCTGCCQIPEYESKDEIVLKRRGVEFSKSTPMLAPKEQYDIRAIQEWCKKHSGKYAMLKFGNKVKFNVIESVSQILFENNIPYFLSKTSSEGDDADIKLSLYQHHQAPRDATTLSEEEAILKAIPSINADYPGSSTNDYDYCADYKLGIWTVYPYYLRALPSAEILDEDGSLIRTLLKE